MDAVGPALSAGQSGAVLTASDVVVRNRVAELGSIGVAVVEGGELTLTRAALLGRHESGVVVQRSTTGDRILIRGRAVAGLAVEESSVELEHLIVQATRASEAGQFGDGLQALRDADLSIGPAFLESNTSTGMIVQQSVAAMRDLAIVGTNSTPTSGVFGHGLVLEGTSGSAERVVLNENRGVGVTVVGSASDYRFDDIVIADTLSWRCSEPDWDGPACDTSYGIGFAAMAGISELAGFSVRGSRVAGMSIQSGARLVGSDGEVVNNAIGVHDRSQSFGLEESLDRVVLSDNGVEIDTDELKVPSLAETLETLGEP